MKTIGLIGGMSWESTVTYYQVINEAVRTQFGGLHSARILIHSIDFSELARAQEADDWNTCAKIMIEAGKSLEAAGADFILIGANTMHIVYEELCQAVSVPVLHIADAAISRLKKDGIQRTALLGTKYTLCKDFYKQKIIDSGIEVLIPDERIEELDSIIYDELCMGIIREESKQKLLSMIKELKDNGAQSVILGCTELDLLVKQEDLDIPVYDTTLVHGEEAVTIALLQS